MKTVYPACLALLLTVGFGTLANSGKGAIALYSQSPLLAQFRPDRPNFFDDGLQQLNEQIRRVQQHPPDPVLILEPPATQWQPIVYPAAGFSIWMPPGVFSQETKVLPTPNGKVNFQVSATNTETARYLVAYTEPLTREQLNNPETLFTAVRDRVMAQTDFRITRDRPLTVPNAQVRELTLSNATETTTLRLYLTRQRLYVLSASQKTQANPSNTAVLFFKSFQLLDS